MQNFKCDIGLPSMNTLKTIIKIFKFTQFLISDKKAHKEHIKLTPINSLKIAIENYYQSSL